VVNASWLQASAELWVYIDPAQRVFAKICLTVGPCWAVYTNKTYCAEFLTVKAAQVYVESKRNTEPKIDEPYYGTQFEKSNIVCDSFELPWC
jgi:hypothetical protein